MDKWNFSRRSDDGPAWPVDENGSEIPPAAAAFMNDSQLQVDSAAAMLRAFGIPVRLRYPGDGVLGRIVLGFSGFGVELLVPEDRLEEAVALLEEDASSYADEESALGEEE